MSKEVSIFTVKVLLEAGELFGASRSEMLEVLPDPSVVQKKWGGIDWDHAVELMRVAFEPVGSGADLVPAGQDYLNKRYKTRSAHLYGQYTSWEKALWVAKHLMAGRIVKGHTIDYEKTDEPDRFVVTMGLPQHLTPFPDFLWFCAGVWTGSSDLAKLKHTIHSLEVESHRAVADITFDRRARRSRAVHNPLYSRWKTRRELKQTLREERRLRIRLEQEASNLDTVLRALSDAVFVHDGSVLSPQNQAASDLLNSFHLPSLLPEKPTPGTLLDAGSEVFRVRSHTPLPDEKGHLMILANATREIEALRELDQTGERERTSAARDVESGLGTLLRELERGLDAETRTATDPVLRAQLRSLAELAGLSRQQAKALATRQDREVINRKSLEDAMRDMAQDYREVFGYTVDLRLEGPPPLHLPDQWRDLHLLLREAVRNAYRHSGGDRVTVHMNRVKGIVRDNGQGLVTGTGRTGDPDSGLGCQSIRERAERIGARAELLPEPDNGWMLTFSSETNEGEEI